MGSSEVLNGLLKTNKHITLIFEKLVNISNKKNEFNRVETDYLRESSTKDTGNLFWVN